MLFRGVWFSLKARCMTAMTRTRQRTGSSSGKSRRRALIAGWKLALPLSGTMVISSSLSTVSRLAGSFTAKSWCCVSGHGRLGARKPSAQTPSIAASYTRGSGEPAIDHCSARNIPVRLPAVDNRPACAASRTNGNDSVAGPSMSSGSSRWSDCSAVSSPLLAWVQSPHKHSAGRRRRWSTPKRSLDYAYSTPFSPWRSAGEGGCGEMAGVRTHGPSRRAARRLCNGAELVCLA